MANLCEYYPCHKDMSAVFSCEFCYCPEYNNSECSGTPKIVTLTNGTSKIKDCSDCLVNHTVEYVTNYYKNGGKDKYGEAKSSADCANSSLAEAFKCNG